MTISLVIPVHNLERFIEPLLISLKYQVYDHDKIEPIFICDSCEDLTHELILVYLKKSFKNLKIVDREYHSSGLSRNDGIEMATGDLIWLLDGDDWLIDNHAIAKVVDFFEQCDDNVLHIDFLSNTYKNYKYLYTVWQWVFRSEWAKSVKFTSRRFDDDVEWVQKMIELHNIYVYARLDGALYFYNYMREGSVMYVRKIEEFSEGSD